MTEVVRLVELLDTLKVGSISFLKRCVYCSLYSAFRSAGPAPPKNCGYQSACSLLVCGCQLNYPVHHTVLHLSAQILVLKEKGVTDFRVYNTIPLPDC